MKPIVNYDESKGFHVREGERALVWPMNHPNPNGTVSNTKMVVTSRVVKVIDEVPAGPVFETENTRYVPREL